MACSKSKVEPPNKEDVPRVEAEIVTDELIERDRNLQRTVLERYTGHICSQLKAISANFCRIGFYLWSIREQDLYKVEGFNNIYEYAESAFCFKKSSTSNYIRVCVQFSERKNGRPTDKLSSAYKGYGYTQLAACLLLSEDELKQVTPDMRVSQILHLKMPVDTVEVLETPKLPTAQPESAPPGSVSVAEEPEPLPPTECFQIGPGSDDGPDWENEPPQVIFDEVLMPDTQAILQKFLSDCMGMHIKVQIVRWPNGL